ncbi:uncharacterized protein LOC134811824 [Bolinopsis microptera]|uniref:uncharacterized protein LOC134811824 n=1 Tax=Bolinopsis microptera TaxID=2820187 RepID=UPI0030798674
MVVVWVVVSVFALILAGLVLLFWFYEKAGRKRTAPLQNRELPRPAVKFRVEPEYNTLYTTEELFGSQVQGTSRQKSIPKRDTRIKLVEHSNEIPLEEATVQYKKQEYVTGYILP